MALCVPPLPNKNCSIISLNSEFLPPVSLCKTSTCKEIYSCKRNLRALIYPTTFASLKIVRDPSLDRQVVKQNKIRFVQKLKTLLLSKPKHYLPIHILSKCRSYLSISRPRSLLSMIHRYPSIFELFTIPTPPIPLNATKPCSQLCVGLTPAAEALATQESNLKSAMSITLANKLQKLLMLSSHRRLVLSKLVHVAPDLGLPANFRSRLCNDHPDKFKTVDTSYGRALELVVWDPLLADPLPSPQLHNLGLIVDRPLKFKQLRLRKGLNIKRRHQDFLLKFGDLPDICPYKTPLGDITKVSLEAEKRTCAVVREVLGMMVEKRTLIDHLTHFRKEFGLPNKLRGMLIRHPELFYVSLKGERDSVFLVEAYNEKGLLLEKDEVSVINDRLMELVRGGKEKRREKRKAWISGFVDDCDNEANKSHDDSVDANDDGFENLFDAEDYDVESDDEDESVEFRGLRERGVFWRAEADSVVKTERDVQLEPW